MHERSGAGVERRALLAHHASVLTTDGAAGGGEQLLRLLQPRVRVAAVPRITAPLQLVLLHAGSILPMPRRAAGETVAWHEARRLSGLDNGACEAQQVGEGAALMLKLKHVFASVCGGASDGEGRECGGACERGEARSEQAVCGWFVAGCELFQLVVLALQTALQSGGESVFVLVCGSAQVGQAQPQQRGGAVRRGRRMRHAKLHP